MSSDSVLSFSHYAKAGGTPLVLLHGFLCDGTLFAPNIPVLRKHHSVITIDLPGFGNSCTHTAADSIAAMAQQVLLTLATLPYQQFYLLGHSMGGMVALQMALLAPHKFSALLLYATNSDGHLPGRFETFAQTATRLQKNFAAAKKDIAATWFCDGKQHPHYPSVLRCGEAVSLATALAAITAMKNFNVSEQTAQLKLPTLIIGAEHDRTYSPAIIRALHRRIVHSQLHLIKGCAHNAHLENENEFNTVLLGWLAAQHRPTIAR